MQTMLGFLYVAYGFVLGADSLLKQIPLAQIYVGQEVVFEPKLKHHFNLRAPQKCGDFKFRKKSKQMLTCTPMRPEKILFVISICDDAKTFCKLEKHERDVTIKKQH